MKNRWNQLHNKNSKKPLVEAVNLINELCKIYIDVELKRIKSLIKVVDDNLKE